MKKFFLSCLVIAIAGCGGSESGSDAGDDGLTIAVIPKGTAHIFWKTVHAGAAKAGQEEGVEIIWIGPENEGDRKQQIELVENYVSRQVDAIVLAPTDENALVRPVENAMSRNIPVVVIDSGVKTDNYVSFVATDNKEGGRLGARRLGEVLGGKGKVILLRYAEGSASTTNREEGFLEEMASKFPDIELISTNQYAGVTKETGIQASTNLLNRFADVDGVFCANESSTFGMMRALETSGKAGKIALVGFDTSDTLLEGMATGKIVGLVSQDPFDIGYQGVKMAVASIRGEEVPKRLPTRLEMITPDNVNDESIKELIHPDVDKWLN
ncbi:MAG: substrate-binding domain-containing protein [Candidatus Hydrogenedentota bacterium]